jgi:hypothetical protein
MSSLLSRYRLSRRTRCARASRAQLLMSSLAHKIRLVLTASVSLWASGMVTTPTSTSIASSTDVAYASASCLPRVIHPFPSVRRAIGLAHAAIDRGRSKGPIGRVYYGRCGSAYYALAFFRLPGFEFTDQPEAFSRRPNQRWHDLGDTGGKPAQVPLALRRAWHCGGQHATRCIGP